MRLSIPALLLATSAVHAEPWSIDAAHTRVGFSVPHLVVSTVEGRFRDVKGTVDIDDRDPTRSRVDLTIAAASLDTGNERRDGHLKSADFFDAAKYPTLGFKSTRVAKVGKGAFRVTGDITIHGVRKAVTLDVSLSDPLADPSGKPVRAARVQGKLNRHDFGLDWNKSLDKGALLIGDDVTLDVQFELGK